MDDASPWVRGGLRRSLLINAATHSGDIFNALGDQCLTTVARRESKIV